LPGSPGVRCIYLRWLYQEPEPLQRPNLTPPQVADALPGTTLWTVIVPGGWEMARGSTSTRHLGSGPARQAALALYRAQAQLQIRQQLAKQRSDSAVSAALSDAQQRFQRYCVDARQALDLGADRRGITGPQGQSLSQWLSALQERNRSVQSEQGEDKARDTEARRQGGKEKKAEVDVSVSPCLLVSLSETSGTPMSWHSSPDGQLLELRLTPRESQRTRQALAASGQWLGGLVVVWLLSFVPLLLMRLRMFWPEQIALVGVIGWHVEGLTLVVLLLLAAAACARVVLLARGLRRLFRKRRKQSSTLTPTSGEPA
jgi:hypothetical protein